MVFTAALSTPTDRRSDSLDRRPVWEQIVTYTIDAGDGHAEVKQAIPINGILQKIICKVGAATGITGTVNLAIDDNSDNEIFAVTSLAESTTYTYNVYEPLSGIIDVGLDPSDDPTSGSWTVTVTLRGI